MTADIFFDIIDKSHINKCASLSFQCQIQGMEEVGGSHSSTPPSSPLHHSRTIDLTRTVPFF